MPTRFSKFALSLTILAALAACGGSRVNVDMPGKWVCNTQIEFQTTFEFRDDGTFTKSVKIVKDLPPPANVDGTWKLDSDLKLHLELKSGGEETHQVIINAGIPSFTGDGDQIFYKQP